MLRITIVNTVLASFLIVLPLCIAQLRTFANTKFDLSPNMPADSELDSIQANVITEVQKATVDSTKTSKKTETKPTTTTMIPKLITGPIQTSTIQPLTLAPLNVQMPTAFVVNPLIRQPMLPMLPALPEMQMANAKALTPFNATAVVQPTLATATSSTSKPSDVTYSWYQDDYDVTDCVKDLQKVSVEFKKKFPTKISTSGKDLRIADVILHRLAECQKKEKRGHWDEVDKVVSKLLTISKSQITECQNALVEERIACTNLLSYACQFSQPSFQFRLLPAKLIIAEARTAETATDVCRVITEQVKQRLNDVQH